jgi:hypothetical protein
MNALFLPLILGLFTVDPATAAPPPTIHGMIQAWLTDDSIMSEDIDLTLYSVAIPKKGNVYYLNAKIENKFQKSLCIPTNLFHPSDLLGLRILLNVYDADNKPVAHKYGEPSIKWPTNQYVILLPSASTEVSIILSDYFQFEKGITPYAASFTFPAFFCDVLERGYPISDWLSPDMPLAKIGPLTVIENNEIVVFRGRYPDN